MATIKGGGKNGKKGEPNGLNPIEATRDLFSEFAEDDLALDWREVNAKALHSVIARVCRIGGYIGFSAPAGGSAVKLRCTVGDSEGQRWVRSGTELSAFLLAIHKRMEEGKPGDEGRAEDSKP